MTLWQDTRTKVLHLYEIYIRDLRKVNALFGMMTLASARIYAVPALLALCFSAFADGSGGMQKAYAYNYSSASLAANFLDGLFEYKVELDASQIFPNKQIKHEIIEGHQARNFTIARLDHEVIGFHVSATGVKIKVSPSSIDADKTRINVDVQGKDVAVDSDYIHKKYGHVDVDTVYGVYSAKADKAVVHIPFETALSLLLQ